MLITLSFNLGFCSTPDPRFWPHSERANLTWLLNVIWSVVVLWLCFFICSFWIGTPVSQWPTNECLSCILKASKFVFLDVFFIFVWSELVRKDETEKMKQLTLTLHVILQTVMLTCDSSWDRLRRLLSTRLCPERWRLCDLITLSADVSIWDLEHRAGLGWQCGGGGGGGGTGQVIREALS